MTVVFKIRVKAAVRRLALRPTSWLALCAARVLLTLIGPKDWTKTIASRASTPSPWPDLPEPSDVRVLALHAPHGPDLAGVVPVSVAA